MAFILSWLASRAICVGSNPTLFNIIFASIGVRFAFLVVALWPFDVVASGE
jgi:prepilin signal peptidase PulO-like enzyme (type II secretory pathway)